MLKAIIIIICLLFFIAGSSLLLFECFQIFKFNQIANQAELKLEINKNIDRKISQAIEPLQNIIKQEKAKREQTEIQTQEARKKADAQISDLQQKIEDSKLPDLTEIIFNWQPIIANITCDFYYDTGQKYATQAGSGVLRKNPDTGKIHVFTNKHVAVNQEQYAPKYCEIKFPDQEKFKIDNSSLDLVRISAQGYDWATIDLKSAPSKIKNLAYDFKVCENKPEIGDDIVILGYPAIGSETNITATEGIVSGYDGDYYITSAKIEKGNSGGTAIVLKNNCHLGIPTFAKVGQIESLSRILKSSKIFDLE